MIEIRQYVDRLGRSAFDRWWSGKLDAAMRARITVSLDRLERGNTSGVKSVGAGVMELRMHVGPGYRVYFGMDGETLVILLGGGSKTG